MAIFDEEAHDYSNYSVRYKCLVCQVFFELGPLSPTICPYCGVDARSIVGPIPVKEIDLDKWIRKHEQKYRRVTRK